VAQGVTDWRVSYAIFARSGLTEAALEELRAHGGLAVDAQRLMLDLADS
jgi:hypothetical protein